MGTSQPTLMRQANNTTLEEYNMSVLSKSFKGRTASTGQVVQVYRNLHNGLWSVKDKESGLVLGHDDVVVLQDAKFIVKEAGRQRVLREQKKNVHAYVEGILLDPNTVPNDDLRAVTYNPYCFSSFVSKNIRGTWAPIYESSYVCLIDKYVYAEKERV